MDELKNHICGSRLEIIIFIPIEQQAHRGDLGVLVEAWQHVSYIGRSVVVDRDRADGFLQLTDGVISLQQMDYAPSPPTLLATHHVVRYS